jgi:hypothetical protein
MPDVADVDGLGLVVVGLAVVGFGRWDVGCVAGVALVGDELGVGDGEAVVGGAWGAGSDDGMTSVGEPVLGSPPRKIDVVSAAPPQHSTSNPATGRSSTTRRRRPGG